VALGLGAVVRFAGTAFGVDKLRLLNQADVLVLPSYSEGLPCALLEGMAAGNAVIATHVGGIPDVAIAGVHGVLVPPRDTAALARAIADLDADRAGLARMGTECRIRIARNHSPARLAQDFGEVYAHLHATDQQRRCAA
jgi:glycosyltransferase involved in cell wall biosynthesis